MTVEAIKNVCADLGNSEWPIRLAGNCIAASDIVQSMLYDQGVDSEIIECTLTIGGYDIPNQPAYAFIGYDKIDGVTKNPSGIDTHVVVITKSEPPMLIDFGVRHRLDATHNHVCVEVNSVDPRIITEAKLGNLNLVYRIKERIKLPAIHQKSLHQRATESQETHDKLSYLDKMLKFVAGAALINFVTNIAILVFNK